jgi:hypothetical protein
MLSMNLPFPRDVESLDETFLHASLDEPFLHASLDEPFLDASLDESFLHPSLDQPIFQQSCVQAAPDANDGGGGWSSMRLLNASPPQDTVMMKDIYPYILHRYINDDEVPVLSCLYPLCEQDEECQCDT